MSDTFRRRRYLKSVGAVGAIGLAGCMGGDGGQGDGETTTEETTTATTTGETTAEEGGTVRYLSDRGGRDIWESAISRKSRNTMLW